MSDSESTACGVVYLSLTCCLRDNLTPPVLSSPTVVDRLEVVNMWIVAWITFLTGVESVLTDELPVENSVFSVDKPR